MMVVLFIVLLFSCCDGLDLVGSFGTCWDLLGLGGLRIQMRAHKPLFYVINKVDAGLGHGERLVVFAIVCAAMLAVVLLEPCVAHIDADFGLKAPVGRENPGVAIENTRGHHVALVAVILKRGIEAEGELDVRPVEMAVGRIHTDVAPGKGGAEPTPDLGRYEEVAILCALGIVGGEGIEPSIEAARPLVAQAKLYAQIGCERSIVEKIVFHDECLRRHLRGTDEH